MLLKNLFLTTIIPPKLSAVKQKKHFFLFLFFIFLSLLARAMLLEFLFLTTIIAQNHSASQAKNLFFLKKNRPSRGGLL